MDGERIAAIYRELGFPSAPQVPDRAAQTGHQRLPGQPQRTDPDLGLSSDFQATAQYKGNVASRSIDDLWVADVLSFESRPVEGFTSVLLNQDVFNRFLWATPMGTKKETTRAF